MDNFKIRQVELVKLKIRDFHSGALGLNLLIQQLEGLARAIGDDFWCNQAFPIVADLEGINSELIDKRRKATPAELFEIGRLLRSLEGFAEGSVRGRVNN